MVWLDQAELVEIDFTLNLVLTWHGTKHKDIYAVSFGSGDIFAHWRVADSNWEGYGYEEKQKIVRESMEQRILRGDYGKNS